MHPFINLGLFRLPTYGVLLCLAILLGVPMAVRRTQDLGIDRERAYAYLSIVVAVALLGAKLTDWVIARGSLSLRTLVFGGGTFLGGFLFAALACYLAAHRAKIPLLLLADACAPSLALGVAIVRIGCFGASCDYGKPTDLPWAVVFTRPEAARLTGVPLGVPLHPSQLYESALGAVLFASLLVLEQKERRQGYLIFVFAALYSVGRFLLEFLRGDVNRGFWGPFSTSQWLSLLALLVFAALYLPQSRKGGPSRYVGRLGLTLLLTAGSVLGVWPAPCRASEVTDIDEGFRLLYELRFDQARARFLSWQERHPEDETAYAWLAASDLFEELYEQGVLTSEFFLDDRRLLGGIRGRPDEKRASMFQAAVMRAEELARQRLRIDSRDPQALFALTITTGMEADYAGLLEKQQLQSLKLTREAEKYAETLLSVKPDAVEAYVTLGAANYIIGSLPAHKRLLLWFGGIRGDRLRGVMQLQLAAMDGHYLRPFAKVLLALVARRENQPELARKLLEELCREFPANPLFRRELALLKEN